VDRRTNITSLTEKFADSFKNLSEEKSMARFGLFDGSNAKASQEYEGDKMSHGVNASAEYVEITTGTGTNRRTVAVIRLAPGQSVKEIR
jgi:hypothetical protein